MSQLQWALEYAARGWAVMPCHWTQNGLCSCGAPDCGSPGKHPRPRRGSHDATTSDVQIAGWWRDIWPRANIGIATGSVSGLYVIDLDGPEAVAEWATLEPITDPPTLQADTGGGGRHIYYQQGAVKRPNTAKRIGRRIDSRGEGGYVLAPESNHRSGGTYRWRNWPCAVQPLPAWVIARLADATVEPMRRPRSSIIRAIGGDDPAGIKVLNDEFDAVVNTAPGGRNDQLFKSASAVFGLVAGGDIRLELALDALEQAGLMAGLTSREVKTTLASAQARAEPRRIRTRQEAS
jgi:hypothetical protein